MRYSIIIFFFAGSCAVNGQTPHYDQTRPGFIVFHPIRSDAQGNILPWYADDPATSYNHIVRQIWNFWDTMRRDMNGLPYYMNHQVWVPSPNDPRGIGGDQFAMALSSWRLLYQYTGNERIRENMKFIAEYYLSHGLSPENAVWPNLPYPYNTFIYSGFYDGDMVEGKDITQPDKAGSFGYELVQLFRLTQRKYYMTTTTQRYLDAAIRIANTLAEHTVAGDSLSSPLPFKVNAITGEAAHLKSNSGDGSVTGYSSYTSNWSGTLSLFAELIQLDKGDTAKYGKAYAMILDWMKKYPLQDNRWGPFFEDVPGWSDTQINAVTFARFILEHREYFPDWKRQVNGIFDWVYGKLGNRTWIKNGVTVINEQTAYQTPGNSHTSREAATELAYVALSGDSSRKTNAIRQLNWASYCVDTDGKNNYPRDEVWLTDGYGDFVRHYLRAMAAVPDLAPGDEDHILSSTSVVNQADYAPDLNKSLNADVPFQDITKVRIYYRVFDQASVEKIRMAHKPVKLLLGKQLLKERTAGDAEGWVWLPMEKGGMLTVTHRMGNEVTIYQQ